jgi:hypothetical protein
VLTLATDLTAEEAGEAEAGEAGEAEAGEAGVAGEDTLAEAIAFLSFVLELEPDEVICNTKRATKPAIMSNNKLLFDIIYIFRIDNLLELNIFLKKNIIK